MHAIGQSAGDAAGRQAGPGPARATASRSCRLRNISATSAAQFIQPLVASPEDIRIDPGRNAILFSGTGVERQNVLETLADLDVDWMAGKSIGLFPLQRANAEAVIPELQAIFAPFDPTGAEPSLVRFLPLARLNAVLAIAGDPQQVREVGDWVDRLDRGQAAGTQFYVYYLKHARGRGRRQAAERGVQRGRQQPAPGPASPRPAPRWAARPAARRGRRGQRPAPHGPGAAAPSRLPATGRRPPTAGQGRRQQGQQLAADPGHARPSTSGSRRRWRGWTPRRGRC